MLFNAPLIFLFLALFVTASPIQKATSGVRVPLHGHVPTLTKPDGTFDLESAIAHTAAIGSKHMQNLINLQHNTGRGVLDKVAHFATVSGGVRRRQSEPLTEEGGGALWIGRVSIGLPRQDFLINFDTGSADLWVPSQSCMIPACSGKRKYSASSSDTSAVKPGNFSIKYADGSTVSGPVYTDVVDVAGVFAVNQYFSPVTSASPSLRDEPADGILGLAFPAISNLNQNTFFATAFEQGSVPQNVFSFKLASNDSSLFLGGTDASLFTGSIEYHDVNAKSGYWQIQSGRVLIGSTTAVSGLKTIIDSGTTLIYGPPRDVATFYSKVPGAEVFDAKSGFYVFPCAATPAVSFNWGGRNWPITEENFIIGRLSDGNQCIGAIVAQDFGLGPSVWLLGDSFMKNMYTVFSFERNAVGFATLA